MMIQWWLNDESMVTEWWLNGGTLNQGYLMNGGLMVIDVRILNRGSCNRKMDDSDVFHW